MSFKLVEWYHTIQTEGFNAGRRALFLRLPFCNLTCPWCDTEFNHFTKFEEKDLVKAIMSEDCRFAVLTGGEPTMNKQLPRLIEFLKKFDFTIAVETNGTFPIPEGIDWVTVSPKRYTKDKKMEPFFVHEDAKKKASEFKYVIDEEFDMDLLDRHITSGPKHYYLSPEYNNMEKSLKRIFEHMKRDSGWRLSLQTHKWMEID
jgi:7-carboxy-7-deazaguanine synthase